MVWHYETLFEKLAVKGTLWPRELDKDPRLIVLQPMRQDPRLIMLQPMRQGWYDTLSGSLGPDPVLAPGENWGGREIFQEQVHGCEPDFKYSHLTSFRNPTDLLKLLRLRVTFDNSALNSLGLQNVSLSSRPENQGKQRKRMKEGLFLITFLWFLALRMPRTSYFHISHTTHLRYKCPTNQSTSLTI